MANNHQNLRVKFLRLYDNHHDSVYRFIRFKVKDAETAQDLASEAFTRAWDSVARNGSKYPKNERAYIFRIARNCVIDHYRKNSPEVPVDDHEILSYLDKRDFSDLDTSYLDTDKDMKYIVRALKDMSESDAELITLRYVEDMSHKEIANVVGKNEGAVRTGLHRALKELRQIINDQ